jgi:hypothetical protein
MSAEKLIAELGRFDDDRSVRIAVPTDQGFHRCLDIRALAFGDGDALSLECEGWESAYPILRIDAPPDGGVAEPEPVDEPEAVPTVENKVA